MAANVQRNFSKQDTPAGCIDLLQHPALPFGASRHHYERSFAYHVPFRQVQASQRLISRKPSLNDQFHCLSTKLLRVPAIRNLFHPDTSIRFYYQILVSTSSSLHHFTYGQIHRKRILTSRSWNQFKNHRIGQMVIKPLDDIVEKVGSAMRSIQRTPALIRSFFHTKSAATRQIEPIISSSQGTL